MTRLFCVFAAATLLLAGGCGKDEPDSPSAALSESNPEAEGEAGAAEQQRPSRERQEPAEAEAIENANRPPVLESVRLTPIDAVPGSEIEAHVEASDPEGDPVLLEYTWYRNNEVLRGELFERLATEGLEKGDLIWVEVVPHDGETRGKAIESAPVLLHNRPPEITSYPPAGLKNGQYTYQVEAEDPDGDRLEYALEGAPQGMTIDVESGLVTWDVSEDRTGGFQVRITVSDGDARAYQSFSMKVAPENQ